MIELKKNNDIINGTLILPIVIFDLVYNFSIKQFYWRSTLICSGDKAVLYISLWLIFFSSIWIYVYYKTYKNFLEKIYPIIIIYLIFNPIWVLFFYLNKYYINNKISDNKLWVLICIIAISAISLKVYNVFYIKLLKYLANKKEEG